MPEVTTLQWHYYPAKNKPTTTQQVEGEGETVAVVVVASGFDIHVLWLKKTSKHHKPQVRLHYELHHETIFPFLSSSCDGWFPSLLTTTVCLTLFYFRQCCVPFSFFFSLQTRFFLDFGWSRSLYIGATGSVDTGACVCSNNSNTIEKHIG